MKYSKSHTFLVAFLGISLFFFIINRVSFFTPSLVETGTSYITYPIVLWDSYVTGPIKHKLDSWTSLDALQREYEDLKVENDALRALNIKLESTLSFAQEINEVVEYKSRYDTQQMKLAHIIQRHIADDTHYVLLDVGANDSISTDMVAVYKNCLVGRVVEVYPYYSKLLLITDSRCKISAACMNTNVHGIHEGTCTTDTTKLSHVSHLLKLEDSDYIVSTGEGLVFPKGFGLGTIKYFEQDGIQYKVCVNPLINIQSINYCYIIKKNNSV